MRFTVPHRGEVSAILHVPRGAEWLYVLGHGAGAGMRHAFMEDISARLGDRKIATLRYQFPYIESKRRAPDPPAVAEATVRAAVRQAHAAAPELMLVAGGKSFGGRMTSQAQAHEALPGVRGLVFLGFPLHPPNKPGDKRAAHLFDVRAPMLFLQGARDALASMELIAPLCERLGDRASLHVVDGGDHSFKVPTRSGRTETEVMDELADTIAAWLQTLTRS